MEETRRLVQDYLSCEVVVNAPAPSSMHSMYGGEEMLLRGGPDSLMSARKRPPPAIYCQFYIAFFLRSAQRRVAASEIRLRPAALRRRRLGLADDCAALGGRPRLGRDEMVLRAAMARSSRPRSAVSSATIRCRFTIAPGRDSYLGTEFIRGDGFVIA